MNLQKNRKKNKNEPQVITILSPFTKLKLFPTLVSKKEEKKNAFFPNKRQFDKVNKAQLLISLPNNLNNRA